MSEKEDRTFPRGCRRMGCATFIVVFTLSTLLQQSLPLEFIAHAIAGWVPYLVKVIPQITWNPEITACSLGALVLGVLGLHWLMPRLLPGRRWPLRWSLAWCGLLVVLFATSIAAVGVVHQVAWLFRAPQWIDIRGMSHLVKSVSNARQVHITLRQYADKHDGLLPNDYRQLIGNIITDSRICFGRIERDGPDEPWVYLGAGLSVLDDSALPVLVSPRSNSRGERILARLDGSVEVISEAVFKRALELLDNH